MLAGPCRHRLLRVAHVVQQLRTGGMERLLVEFARHADRTGHHLQFICLGERAPLANEIEACGWEVICLDQSPGLRPGLVWRLMRAFLSRRIDVVHTHNNNAQIYGGPAAWLAGAAVVQTRHGQTVGTSRRHRALFRAASAFADRVVCVSRDSRRLSAEEGVTSRKLDTIWNGIDTRRFAFAGPVWDGPAVMVGRMVPLKGVDTLLRAVAQVIAECPTFRLEVAGDGEALPGLKRMAGELGLTGQVRFLGEVGDVASLLGRASLFVLPSYSEGISLTLLEAMARGLPVVATTVGGNVEVVLDGETGLLVPPRDPGSLAQVLAGLWRDPDRARRLGQAGRRRVEQSFDVRRMVASYEALYRRLTPRRGREDPVPFDGLPQPVRAG